MMNERTNERTNSSLRFTKSKTLGRLQSTFRSREKKNEMKRRDENGERTATGLMMWLCLRPTQCINASSLLLREFSDDLLCVLECGMPLPFAGRKQQQQQWNNTKSHFGIYHTLCLTKLTFSLLFGRRTQPIIKKKNNFAMLIHKLLLMRLLLIPDSLKNMWSTDHRLAYYLLFNLQTPNRRYMLNDMGYGYAILPTSY